VTGYGLNLLNYTFTFARQIGGNTFTIDSSQLFRNVSGTRDPFSKSTAQV